MRLAKRWAERKKEMETKIDLIRKTRDRGTVALVPKNARLKQRLTRQTERELKILIKSNSNTPCLNIYYFADFV